MTSLAYPLDNFPGGYAGQKGRQALGVDLVIGDVTRPLGARSGVRLGSPNLVSLNTGASPVTWQVQPHNGVLDKGTALAGAYRYATDGAGSETTGSVNAANASNPRVDIIWVKVNDPAMSDGSSTPGVVFGYTSGAASSTPPIPAAPAGCMTLAQISVPKAGGGNPTVVTVAPILRSDIAFVRNVAEQALLPIVDGLLAFRLDLDCIIRCDGSNWYPTVDFWPGGQNMQVGTPPPAGQPVVKYSGTAALTTATAGGWTLGLPSGRFQNGYIAGVVPGDSTNDLVGCNLILANCDLNNLNGIAYAPGARMASGKAIRIKYDVLGW